MAKTKTSLGLNYTATLTLCLSAFACASGDMSPDSQDAQSNTCEKGRSDNRLDCVTPLDDIMFAQAKGDFAFTMVEKFTNRKDYEITWSSLHGPFAYIFYQSSDDTCKFSSVDSNKLNDTTELKTNAVMEEDGTYYFCVFAESNKYPTIPARNNGFHLTLDTVAPRAPTMNAASITTNPQPRWDWSSDDPTASKYFRAALGSDEFSEDSPSSTGTYYQPDTPLEDGSYTLFVQVRDEAGNWSPSAFKTTIIDTTPPTPTLIQLTDADDPDSLQVLISFNESVNGFTPEDIKLENAALEDFSESTDLKSYTVTLSATGNQPIISIVAGCCTDIAGNLNMAESSLIIQTMAD